MGMITGIHHVTAIAGDPQRNLDFYRGVLGLRFVKRSVNFDDPHTYHFYFGDERGSPGSLLTFFPWPGANRGRQGVGQLTVTSLAIVPAALGFWIDRLITLGVKYTGPTRRGSGATSESVLSFSDPDGLAVELVAHPSADARAGWAGAAGIDAGAAIRGVHAVTIWVEGGSASDALLREHLGFRVVSENGSTRRYAPVGHENASGAWIDVRAVGGFPAGQPGSGTVHHVAWRVPDDDTQRAVRERLERAGFEPTPVRNRHYFRSVYFREPGGVLFELATDGPGFTIDEPVERLGERLMLPPQFEARRREIESVLPAISTASDGTPRHPPFSDHTGTTAMADDALGFVHRFVPAATPGGDAATLLLLHGTGGDEDNLIALGRALVPGAALLSPRGKVNEGGALRFFRRIREGVFDQEDLARRTDELARFIEAAADAYALPRERIVAVGFSNGANIAGSLLLRRPGLVSAAVLLSPMVPFEPDPRPDLSGTSVFIGAGRADAMVPAAQTERLAQLLREAGAAVTIHWDPGGHAITPAEVTAAQRWLAESVAPRT